MLLQTKPSAPILVDAYQFNGYKGSVEIIAERLNIAYTLNVASIGAGDDAFVKFYVWESARVNKTLVEPGEWVVKYRGSCSVRVVSKDELWTIFDTVEE